MRVLQRVPLRFLTTLKVGGAARIVFVAECREDIAAAARCAAALHLPLLPLGGGSNVLLPEWRGAVLLLRTRGMMWEDKEDTVLLHVAGGEPWDAVVALAVRKGLWGLENLSGIPGRAGAAPVQNISAYGAELAQVIAAVEAYDTKAHRWRRFTARECAFGYRDSIFKREQGRYLIAGITLRLRRTAAPNLAYRDLAHFPFRKPAARLTPEGVRRAVLEIRARKFPSPLQYGTAGSFFKNPVLAAHEAQALARQFPGVPLHAQREGVKVSLGWILEYACALKGIWKGDVGLYEKHALVLVTREGATARAAIDFAKAVARTVRDKTGLTIEPEVCIGERNGVRLCTGGNFFKCD